MTTEPISLAEARAHLRAEPDDPYISDLAGYVKAARQTVEQYLNASVVIQTRTLVLDQFPSCNGAIVLPNGPVISVTSIAYIDADGVSQTVADHWRSVDTITPAYFESWPVTRDVLGAVTITYQAGMMTGSPPVLAETDITAAIKLTLADLWDNRATGIVGTIHTVNPTTERLLHYHRRDLGV